MFRLLHPLMSLGLESIKSLLRPRLSQKQQFLFVALVAEDVDDQQFGPAIAY